MLSKESQIDQITYRSYTQIDSSTPITTSLGTFTNGITTSRDVIEHLSDVQDQTLDLGKGIISAYGAIHLLVTDVEWPVVTGAAITLRPETILNKPIPPVAPTTATDKVYQYTMVSYLNQVVAEDIIRRAILAPFSATDKCTLVTQEHPLISMMPLAALQARVHEVFAPTRAHEVVEIQASLALPIGPASMAEHKEIFCKKTTYLSKVNECPPPAVQKAAITASVGDSGGTFKLAVESFTRLPLQEQTTVAYFKLLLDEEARLQAATWL